MHIEKYLCIGSCACASTPGLDAVEIVEEHGDEVMMQHLACLLVDDHEGEDREAAGPRAAQEDQVPVHLPSLERQAA